MKYKYLVVIEKGHGQRKQQPGNTLEGRWFMANGI